MTMLKMMDTLTNDYKQMNRGLIQELCQVAEVDANKVSLENSIIDLLLDKGVIIRSSKFNVKDVAVGQYLVLRKVTGEFIKGFKVWIDLKDYGVKKINLSGEQDIVKNGGFGNATRGPLQ